MLSKTCITFQPFLIEFRALQAENDRLAQADYAYRRRKSFTLV